MQPQQQNDSNLSITLMLYLEAAPDLKDKLNQKKMRQEELNLAKDPTIKERIETSKQAIELEKSLQES